MAWAFPIMSFARLLCLHQGGMDMAGGVGGDLGARLDPADATSTHIRCPELSGVPRVLGRGAQPCAQKGAGPGLVTSSPSGPEGVIFFFLSAIISLNYVALSVHSRMFLRTVVLDPHGNVVVICILQMRKWRFRKLKSLVHGRGGWDAGDTPRIQAPLSPALYFTLYFLSMSC